MLEDGANIRAWDPAGVESFKRKYPNEVTYCHSIEETIKDSDICFIFTEWDEIKDFDLSAYSKLMKRPIVIDGRNCYSLTNAKKADIIYDSIGRETVNTLKYSLVY